MEYDEATTALGAKKMGEIDNQIVGLEMTIFSLENFIEDLHKRLEPVLLSTQEKLGEGSGVLQEILAPLPTKIRVSTNRIQDVNNRIKRILSDIQL